MKKTKQEEDTFLTIKEVAKTFSVSPSLIRKEIDKGSLPVYKIGGPEKPRIRVRKSEMFLWIEQFKQIGRPA